MNMLVKGPIISLFFLFGQNEELSQANIRIGLLEKRLENINKEVRVVLFP